jgi:hypothetical protein
MTEPTDDEFGRHHFLAWSRQGIATTLDNPDYGGSLPDRPTITVDLNVSAQGPDSVTAVPTVTVHTFGPGDVLGIDPRQVVRTEPKESTPNFEPNYLAGIEFDTPDLPWLFTPASPAGDRLRPWITLIVLSLSEYQPVPGVVTPLPAIDVLSIAALQSLDDAWNWAHTQVSGDAGLAASDSASVISRLLCPRRLDPETTYTAFVVPTFEIGRLAGLALDVSAVHTSDPAWTPTTGVPLRLPVFYQFGFHTSDQGDFESLVRRLVPRKFGADIGERAMAVNDPMPDVPSAGSPLMLDGALQSIVATTTEWDDPAKTAFQTGVAGLVDRVSPLVDDPTAPDPQVVPPMYGRWPAGVDNVVPGGTRWIDQLSLDPRNRTMAGMGTQVVQANQTALLASAWQQVAGIEAANAALRRAQLARATMTMLHSQLSAVRETSLVSLTAPLHAKLLASPMTVRALIDASRVPLRLTSPAARRLTHPTSVIRRRQVAISGARTAAGSLIAAVNAGTASFVPAITPPGGLVPIEQVGASASAGPGGPGSDDPWRRWFPLTLTADTPIGDFTISIDVDAPRPANPVTISPDVIANAPPRADFVITAPGAAIPPATAGGSTDSADSVQAALFRKALTPLAQAWADVEPDPPLAAALDLSVLCSSLIARLDPTETVPNRMAYLVAPAARLNWHPVDPIREIMAAPSFPQPMYAPLRDLSVQYVMPGADAIPNESVGLVQTNHAFIESYMVGLSHEMARQLLFAGYPTDCMGTYFRQFWDVSGYVPQVGDPSDPQALAELLRDIPSIVTWPLADPLGAHENRPATVPNPIVLIVRGELLRRYPDAIIYAAKAKIDGQQRTIDDTAPTLHPIFSGLLLPDMNFFGFNLSVADAKGGTLASPEGYFFVFQQHPSGPRFGLEPSADGLVTQWADLAWTNFGSGGTEGAHESQSVAERALLPPYTKLLLASSTMVDVLAQRPIPPFLSASEQPTGATIAGPDAAFRWGLDAAQTAYITARLPFRVGIHADLMIPES